MYNSVLGILLISISLKSLALSYSLIWDIFLCLLILFNSLSVSVLGKSAVSPVLIGDSLMMISCNVLQSSIDCSSRTWHLGNICSVSCEPCCCVLVAFIFSLLVYGRSLCLLSICYLVWHVLTRCTLVCLDNETCCHCCNRGLAKQMGHRDTVGRFMQVFCGMGSRVQTLRKMWLGRVDPWTCIGGAW